MPGFTPFTDNYSDLSDERGYQFEFRCDICGSGYRSEFQRSALGSAGSLLGGASNLIGGLWGAQGAARGAKDFMDRGARDEALKKAANEIMPLFQRCPRDSRWVDETCWNEARGLCISDAPKLAAEMEAERAQVEVSQMRQAMQGEQVFSGDVSARVTVCTNCGKPVGSEKFCANCGTPTGQDKCDVCGTDLAPGARFCANCGKPTGATA
jgi:ribosomal protein L32